MSYHSFRLAMREARHLYEARDYTAALDQLTQIATRYPDHRPQVLLWQAMIHSLNGHPQLGISLLETALEQGIWYTPTMLDQDPDAAGLRELPGYTGIRATCEERMAAARATSTPEILMIAPEGTQEPWPLLIALHGNNQNAHIACEYWWHATSAGWLTALPQSSQASGINAFVWDDDTITLNEITAHHDAIRQHYPLDDHPPLLAGFSRGAEAALMMALTSALPAAGFIAASPAGPFMGEPERWADLLAKNPPPPDMRGVLMIGEEDPYFAGVTQLAEILGAYGVNCWLDSIPGLDHNFPSNLSAHLEHAYDFLLL